MFHGISVSSLLLIFLIAIVVFGTKHIRNIGEDLGVAIKSFRKGLQDEKSSDASSVNAADEDKRLP